MVLWISNYFLSWTSKVKAKLSLMRDKLIFLSERILRKDYYRKSSAGKHLWSWASRGLAPRQTDTLTLTWAVNPCGHGVEYLHRETTSRRRRRKGKSQMWDNKIWSRVSRDSDPRKTALARASSIYKDRPILSSERAPDESKTVTVKQ
jgi:hypothetical protein